MGSFADLAPVFDYVCFDAETGHRSQLKTSVSAILRKFCRIWFELLMPADFVVARVTRAKRDRRNYGLR